MYCADSSEWELFGRNTRSAIRGTSSPRKYCHPTQPKTRENRVESKLSAFFFGFMRILLYLRTSACWINSYHAMLERIFQHSPVATATLRSPYFNHSHIFWKIRLRLLNLFFTPHFYMQASNVDVNTIFNR